ncbi:MAG: ABC transporter permease [Thermoleophilaceae bacterium]|nr:ABC transporter permease [Thermoleophilaceae bacterium]
MTGVTEGFRLVGALARRGLNEIIRVPGASLPGVLAPCIFMLGTYSVFGGLALLPGFGGSDYLNWILPVGFIQSAAFTGAATGVNLARDIESGWFDRMLLAPAPRWVVLGGLVVSAGVRVLLPSLLLVAIGMLAGLTWPGVGGIVISLVAAALLAAVMAFWSCGLAMKFRSQDAAPLMQSSGFMLMQLSAVYAPIALLAPWLQSVARVNPFTYVLDAVRAPYISTTTWDSLWPGIVALVGMVALSAWFAVWRIGRMNEV